MINKSKCEAWVEMFMAFLRMTKDLTDDEVEYIKANISIAYGQLKLQELETKDEQVQK